MKTMLRCPIAGGAPVQWGRLALLASLLALLVLAAPSSVLAQNQPPVANAGGDRTVYTGDAVYLNGSATDAENDPIQWWWWTVIEAPAGSTWFLAHETLQNSAFQAFTPGRYLVTLIVDDGFGTSAADTITITVADNQPPVAVATADKTNGPAPLTVQFDGSQSYDPEGKPLKEYYWDFGDGSDSYSAVPPPHTYSVPGIYNVAILAVTDERGAVGSKTLVITVTEPVNQPPVANAGGDRTMYTGDCLMLNGTASDPNGQPITEWFWTVYDAPPSSVWSLFYADVPSAMLCAYTPGQYLVSLMVRNSSGQSLPDVITVTVADNQPPVAIATADKTNGPAPLTVQFDGSQSYDPEGKPLKEYFWDFGDGSAGSYAAVPPPHTYLVPSTYVVILAVTDERGAVGSDTLVITVTDPVNQPPVANAGGDRTMYTGDCLTLNGTASDPDGEPIVLWSWVVESAPPASVWDLLHADLPAAVFCAYTPGQYQISLLVDDPSGGSAPDTITVTVADNQPPVAVATADKTNGPAPLTVLFDGSQSYDPEGKPLAEYYWQFGDGAPGSFGATPPPHTYTVPGTYYVAVLTVSDERGAAGTKTLVITVTDPVNQPPVANAGGDQTMYTGDCLMLNGTASDPDGEPIVLWSWVVESAPAGAVWTMYHAETPTPSLCAQTPGEYMISLLVEDPSGGSVPDVITIIATNNLPPVAVATADKTNGPAPLTVQFDGSQSYDPEGKPLTEYFWDFGDGSAGVYGAVPPPHTYLIPSTYIVILAVTDERAAVGSKTFVITVTEAGDTQAPQVAITALPGTVPLGTGFTLAAATDDSATGNSPIASADYSLDGGLTWNAMAASDGAFNAPLEPVIATVGALPVGVYSVQVRALDSAGNAGLSETLLLAVYDPTGGFVTGGGWINSPAGAFHPELADFAGVTGKASFGFVSKYLKGAKVPTGNTEFQFKAGNLNFKSTAYQWLVVAGARAQFKGEGTINGEGNCAFLLTAIDGQVNGGGGADRFRIKLWDDVSGTVIYDNQAGTSDTDGLVGDGTLLQGGSVVIQKK